MELKVFLTYFGLLITAYNVNPEYKKIKIKLALIEYKIIFFITLILLFISSNEYIQYQLIQNFQIKLYFNYWTYWIWVSKYYIIVSLNFFSLYKILTATQLNKTNSKVFFELIKNFEIEGKYDLKVKIIKENLENIFEYKEYHNTLYKIKNYIYNCIESYNAYNTRIDKGVKEKSKLQKEYLDNGGDFNKLSEIGKLPSTKYTKIENFRKILSEYMRPKPFQNYFSEIYNFILDKKFIKQVIKNDEQLGLEILRYISKYKYFDSAYPYTTYFLKKTLSNSNSLIFKSFEENKNTINFLKDNQQSENGFDLGLIICDTIEKLIIKNQQELKKKYLKDSNNKVYTHINKLYQILKGLETDEMHLAGTPDYIQKELISLIDFSKNYDEQNLAFELLLCQLEYMKDLALKSVNNNFLESNINQLLEDTFKIPNINDYLILRIALTYTDYIFDEFTNIVSIEQRIENFKKFINKNNNQFIILIYLNVFDKNRRDSNKDYSSYIRPNKKLEKYWNEINNFLNKEYEENK